MNEIDSAIIEFLRKSVGQRVHLRESGGYYEIGKEIHPTTADVRAILSSMLEYERTQHVTILPKKGYDKEELYVPSIPTAELPYVLRFMYDRLRVLLVTEKLSVTPRLIYGLWVLSWAGHRLYGWDKPPEITVARKTRKTVKYVDWDVNTTVLAYGCPACQKLYRPPSNYTSKDAIFRAWMKWLKAHEKEHEVK